MYVYYYYHQYESSLILFRFLGITTENTSNMGKSKSELKIPSEDKYAALKDLDCQMKSQMLEKQQEELKQKISSNTELGSLCYVVIVY